MSDPYATYETVVGIEVHAQLSTKSKMYAPDSAAFGAEPNTQVSPISLGHPGTLPRVNEKAVEFAILMGTAMHCTIRRENQFARKNYFYADLPKGYQITQHTTPICYHGHIVIKTKQSEPKRIGITRIHLEEDAGKSLHDQDLNDSLIDLNRAGVPLIEIVSEPDIRSADEAATYVSELRKILMYLEICDGNMEEGSLRCDVNISVKKKGVIALGNRCEVKNLNSIRNVQKVIEYETKRQIDLLENGMPVDQNTLSFDPLLGKTMLLRSKEMANDYRYFPEPDIPPVVISDAFLEKVLAEMPPLPDQLKHKFIHTFGLSEMDSVVLIEHKEFAFYFLALCKHTANYKAALNWLMGPIKSYLNEQGRDLSALNLVPSEVASLIALIDDGKVSHSMATQRIFPLFVKENHPTALQIAKDLELIMDTDENDLKSYIMEALKKYPDKVDAYRSGKTGVAGLFMGEIMKQSKGKADPKLASKQLLEILETYKPV